MPLPAIFSLVAALAAIASPVTAQTATAQSVRTEAAAHDAANEADEAGARNINRDFLGIRFGVGIGVSIDPGPARIVDAQVIDGILRVTRTANHRPRILLETHYFWRAHQEEDVPVAVGDKIIRANIADIGAGPFAAIQSSDEAVLEAFALGLMVGFKREDDSAFNIGVGGLLDPDVKKLGDGLEPDAPIPDGDTIRFVRQHRWGLLLLVSFSF